MKYLGLATSFVLGLSACCSVLAQRGGGGYGGGGMGGGPMGGIDQQQSHLLARSSTDYAISSYLKAPEIKSILTPGEYCEWKLDLKAGQVVIADAQSEMFDPALEVVDSTEKVLATNDDRYPGDQRPLLLFRCPADGSYSLRVRCFKNKAGGQFSLRSQIFDSIDTGPNKTVEKQLAAGTQYLIRIPMKAGEFKMLGFAYLDRVNGLQVQLGEFISPLGLPVFSQGHEDFTPASQAIIAPVDGDYYAYMQLVWGSGKIRVNTQSIAPIDLEQKGNVRTGNGKAGSLNIWRMQAKAGEILEFAIPTLYSSSRLEIWEEPNVTCYNLKDPEKNPFFPSTKAVVIPISSLVKRDRDSRYQVLRILKDATLWISSYGSGPKEGEYALTVKPATMELKHDKQVSQPLAVGSTDYWSFDADLGDVMTLDFSTTHFVAEVQVYDPVFSGIMGLASDPDQNPLHTMMTITKPGRYVVSVRSAGSGGGGDYTIQRKTYPPRFVAKGSPAKDEIAKGETHVWKFTVQPHNPVLFHWKSLSNAPEYRIYNEDQTGAMFSTSYASGHLYGVIDVSKPTTYMVVVTTRSDKSSYLLELLDLPGLDKPK